jgi:dihydroneopterin aldolase
MLNGHWLSVEGIAFKCIIGVTERERNVLQDVVVNVHVKADLANAIASDSIQDTIDYRRIAQCVMTAGARLNFQLIESLAAHLARSLFDSFPAVQTTRIELEKMGALTAARTVKVTITSQRGGFTSRKQQEERDGRDDGVRLRHGHGVGA